MELKNKDRRVRKTKKSLKDGLAKLMLEKSMNDISVKELTEYVDLNRGTFYLHYKDIFDMVEQVENEMLQELKTVMNSHSTKEINCKPLPLLEDAFIFLKENAPMCTVLLSTNGDIAFVKKLKDVVREKCFKDWMILFNVEKADKFEYVYSFILSGCLGLFESWLKDGLKETPKEMAKLAEDIILHGIEIIK